MAARILTLLSLVPGCTISKCCKGNTSNTAITAIAVSVAISASAAQDRLPDYPPAANSQLGSESELTILAPTISPEELDRIVLNRLLLDISRDPQGLQETFGIDAELLKEMEISLSNAAGFINDNDMANIRAMCQAWDQSANSAGTEEERIVIALDAYKARRQFTRDFIARFYRVVVLEIEAILPEPAVHRFNSYLDDRRRRLANAGNVVPGAIVENISGGRDTVDFHCRRD